MDSADYTITVVFLDVPVKKRKEIITALGGSDYVSRGYDTSEYEYFVTNQKKGKNRVPHLVFLYQ